VNDLVRFDNGHTDKALLLPREENRPEYLKYGWFLFNRFQHIAEFRMLAWRSSEPVHVLLYDEHWHPLSTDWLDLSLDNSPDRYQNTG
jgi:hypothetical protein